MTNHSEYELVGKVVIKGSSIGIVTMPIRKSGPNKGRVTVMFAGMKYEISASPDDLTVISPSSLQDFLASL